MKNIFLKSNKFYYSITFLFLLIGSYFQINGLSKRIDFELVVNKINTYEFSILTFLVTLILASVLNYTKKFYLFFIFALVIIFFSLVNSLQILIWSLLILYFCYTVGKYISILFRLPKNEILLNSFVGYGSLNILLYFIIFFKINNFITYALILFVPILIDYLINRKVYNLKNIKYYFSNKFFFSFPELILISIISIYFMVSLMPEIGHDALAMHLFIPSHINNFQIWDFDFQTYVWATLPLAADFFYTFLYVIGGEELTKFSLFIYMVLTLYLINDTLIALSFSRFHRNIMNLLYISTPLMYLVTSSLYIELPWLISLLLLLNVAIKIYLNRLDNYIFYILIFSLLAITTKHISLIFFAVALILLPLFSLKHSLELSKKILENKFSYVFFIMILMPYLYAYYLTGNPFFPFFNNIFESEFFETSGFNNPLYNYSDIKRFLYDFTFHSNKFIEGTYGAAGFFWLIFAIPTALFYLFYQANKLYKFIFFFCILSWISVFYFQSYMRYIVFLIPIFYILFIYALIHIESLVTKNYTYFLRALIFIIIFLNLVHLNSATNYGYINFNVIRNDDKTNYYEKFLPIQYRIKYINRYDLSENKNLLLMSEPQGANFKGKAFYLNWYNPTLLDQFKEALVKDQLYLFFLKNKYDYIIFDKNFLNNNFLYVGNNLTKSEVNKRIISGLASFNLIHPGIYQFQ